MQKKRVFWSALAIMLIAAMVLGACQTTTPTAEEPTGGENVAALPQGQELANAYAGMYTGKVVTMAGPFTDQDEVVFNDSIKGFEEKTGIDIQYTGSKEFEANINIRLDGGDRPDIVDYPQPGLLRYAVEKGYAIDMNTLINPDWIKQNYSQAWQDLGTMTGPNGDIVAGIWARFNGKSIVWYPKKEFDAAGYTVPTTWEELMALSDQIADDGDTPWCIGIESGAATGWPLTDWVEDLMLRTTTPENYDKWISGELDFNSPEVKEALSYITKLWFDDKYVYGGRKAITTTFFGDSPKPMFDAPPKCWMHRQGNFITTFFPEGLTAGEDYDFFYLPPVDPANKPFLVAGDIYAMFNDRPEVRAVFQYFSTGESLKGWMAAGGALSPHKDASLDWYGSDTERKLAAMVAEGTNLRFDASDLMPGAVGSGTFWKKMTDYVSGNIEEDQALQEIDASWPTP